MWFVWVKYFFPTKKQLLKRLEVEMNERLEVLINLSGSVFMRERRLAYGRF